MVTRKVTIHHRVPLKTATPDEMNFSQIWLAKDAGCLGGQSRFLKVKFSRLAAMSVFRGALRGQPLLHEKRVATAEKR